MVREIFKCIAGHSLGNMVISSAMVDHELTVDRYFMINAAVPCEAYNPAMREDAPAAMTHSDWLKKNPDGSDMFPKDLQSARYARLFNGEEDNRKYLTWQGRFAGIQNVHQLYSIGENVLQPNWDGKMPNLVDDTLKKYMVWVSQELNKGRFTKVLAQLISNQNQSPTWINKTAGWSFRDNWAEGDPMPTTEADKKSTPLFKPFNVNTVGKSVHEDDGSDILSGWNDPTKDGYLYMAALLRRMFHHCPGLRGVCRYATSASLKQI